MTLLGKEHLCCASVNGAECPPPPGCWQPYSLVVLDVFFQPGVCFCKLLCLWREVGYKKYINIFNKYL